IQRTEFPEPRTHGSESHLAGPQGPARASAASPGARRALSRARARWSAAQCGASQRQEQCSASALDDLLPEADGIGHPTLGTRAGAEAEAMAEIPEPVILDPRPGLAKGRDPSFHACGGRNPVLLTDDHKGRRFIGRIV